MWRKDRQGLVAGGGGGGGTETETEIKGGRERVPCSWRWFQSLAWDRPSGFLWPTVLLGLGLSPPLARLRTLPPVCTQHLLAETGLWEVGWMGCGLASLTPAGTFCACVIAEVSLTSSMGNRWSLFYPRLLLAPAISFTLKYLFTGHGFQLSAGDLSLSYSKPTHEIEPDLPEAQLPSLSQIFMVLWGHV